MIMELLALLLYLGIVTIIGVYSYSQTRTSSDFILGSRSLSYMLTAMAAHASDMSSWLFMGYPAIIFLGGLFNAWVGIGLLIFMWLNWTYIAPNIRSLTEELQCSTLSLFFEKKLGDHTGQIRIVSSLLCFLFYSVYLCAGLVGLGILGENLLGLDYFWGITLGITFVFLYLFLGGYIALAWLDLFQGVFLLFVILFVPLYLGEGMSVTETSNPNISLYSLIPDYNSASILSLISMILGWGLGYFGQPHILTKFMGIKEVSEMHKSRNVGMAWMILAFLGATSIGIMGTLFFTQGLANPETVFIDMVRLTFHPFFASLILCAIIAATINVMSSQMLVLSSTLSEDILNRYLEKYLRKNNSLWSSRICVFIVALVAYGIASLKFSSIFLLVKYAWCGLGASFGPLILMLLYTKNVTRQGALTGLIVGGATTALWPLVDIYFSIPIDPMIPGFLLSMGSIRIVSKRRPQLVSS